jgi:hypothetical protein
MSNSDIRQVAPTLGPVIVDIFGALHALTDLGVNATRFEILPTECRYGSTVERDIGVDDAAACLAPTDRDRRGQLGLHMRPVVPKAA